VQLELLDAKSRKVDIIHNLKLDRTYTGLQTLGAETHVDVIIDTSACTAGTVSYRNRRGDGSLSCPSPQGLYLRTVSYRNRRG